MKNGSGSACVSPSIVTWRSSIASSSALCALGVARFTSSAITSWANTGPAVELEAPARAVVDRDADDVRGQQVAGELDALVGKAEDARERVRERRLADARDVLDQQVPARQQAGEGEAHFAVLAEQDLVQARERREQLAARPESFDMRLRVHRSEATRSCCSASCASSRLNSSSRSRSCATTSAGALLHEARRCRAWRSRARAPARPCRGACRAGRVPHRRRSGPPSARGSSSRQPSPSPTAAAARPAAAIALR